MLAKKYWGEDLSAGDARRRLIYDDEFSIALTAAYAKYHQDMLVPSGRADNRALFVAHANSDLSVEAYAATGEWPTERGRKRERTHWASANKTVSPYYRTSEPSLIETGGGGRGGASW
jgi:hypothetical protein